MLNLQEQAKYLFIDYWILVIDLAFNFFPYRPTPMINFFLP